MRRLALDIGNKRIGVAVSDITGLYAFPLTTIYRKNISNDIEKLYQLIIEKIPLKDRKKAKAYHDLKKWETPSFDCHRMLDNQQNRPLCP